MSTIEKTAESFKGKSEEEIATITDPEYDINFIADGVIIKD